MVSVILILQIKQWLFKDFVSSLIPVFVTNNEVRVDGKYFFGECIVEFQILTTKGRVLDNNKWIVFNSVHIFCTKNYTKHS